MQKTQATAEVIGAGVLLDGSNVYLVSSQTEEGRAHIVRQEAARPVCDCKGFHYRGRCAHVAAVVAHKQKLELARAEAEAIIAEAASASRGTPATARPAASASAKVPTHGPWFAGRSQQPFSMLKH